jgi:hypothetical protein
LRLVFGGLLLLGRFVTVFDPAVIAAPLFGRARVAALAGLSGGISPSSAASIRFFFAGGGHILLVIHKLF